MTYQNLALTWLKPKMLIKPKTHYNRFQVLQIEADSVQLEQITLRQVPITDNAVSWYERARIERDYYPVDIKGDRLKQEPIDSKVVEAIESITKKIKDRGHDAIIMSWSRMVDIYELDIDLDGDVYEELLFEQLQPVIDYLIGSCDWDRFLEDKGNITT